MNLHNLIMLTEYLRKQPTWSINAVEQVLRVGHDKGVENWDERLHADMAVTINGLESELKTLGLSLPQVQKDLDSLKKIPALDKIIHPRKKKKK